jgi:hypothetical protein
LPGGNCHGNCETLDEFLAPALHCLIGNDDAPFCQEELDFTQAKAEHVVDHTAWLMISAKKRRWYFGSLDRTACSA